MFRCQANWPVGKKVQHIQKRQTINLHNRMTSGIGLTNNN